MGLTPNLRRVLPAVGGLLTVAAACWWLDPAHLQPLGIVAGVLAMGVWLFLFQTAVLQRLVVGASQAGFFLLLNAAWLSAGPAMMAPSDTKMSMGPTPWLTMLVLVVAGLLLSAQAIVFGIPDKPTALFRRLVAGPPPLRPIRLTLRSARSAEEATAALTSRLAAPSLRSSLFRTRTFYGLAEGSRFLLLSRANRPSVVQLEIVPNGSESRLEIEIGLPLSRAIAAWMVVVVLPIAAVAVVSLVPDLDSTERLIIGGVGLLGPVILLGLFRLGELVLVTRLKTLLADSLSAQP